ncbi:MAG: SWIM zinc finger family protein [Promethearchaeota archaeon]
MDRRPTPRKTPYNRKNFQKSNQKKRNHQQVRKEVQEIKRELHGFAQSTWGRKWVNRMLEYGRPFRMQRGIRYAQEERVSNITITPGMIFATVQGTAPTPYRVKVIFDTLSETEWELISDSIAEKAYYTIKLLENTIPDDFETLFENAGLELFPSRTSDLNASCSCPDQAIPCKHIAATILYVARVFDFDPFLLLKLRGKDRSEILAMIKESRTCAKEPISISVKKIRKMVNIASTTFDVPILPSQDLDPSAFIHANSTYKIGFRFSKPGKDINTLDSLGMAPNLEKPDEFVQVFRDLYLNVTQKTYRLATKLGDSK